MNLIRGTGIRGMSGIRPRNGFIVRPLLCVSREDILAWLADQGYAYMVDSTNLSDAYTRNFIRLNVLPLLEEINPSARNTIARSAEHLSAAETIYIYVLEQARKEVVVSDDRFSIGALMRFPAPETILYELLKEYGFTRLVSDDIFAALTKEPGKLFYSSTHRLLKDRDYLWITPLEKKEERTFVLDPEKGINHEPIELSFQKLVITIGFPIEKNKRIAYLDTILNSDEVLVGVFKKELNDIKERYGDDRLTEICEVEDEIDIEDLIERHTAVITMSSAGYIKRLPSDTYTAQHRGGKGITGMSTREEDDVSDVVAVDSHSYLMMFTNLGKVQVIKAYQIPECSRMAKGTNLVNILELSEGEKVTAMLSVSDFEMEEDKEEYLLFVTANGTVKRTLLSEFAIRRKGGKRALFLDKGDELVYVRHTSGKDKILLATKDGMAVCFDENDARVMGRTARGVRGIRLEDGDRVA